MSKIELTSSERKNLRAAAHSLKPIVMIGERGLTRSVLQEIDNSLKAHQLLKIRVSGQDRHERSDTLDEICEKLSCAPVAHMGKILLVWRPELPELQEDTGPIPTRAIRKPNEDYIPKKQAAEGLRRTRKSLEVRREIRQAIRRKRAAGGQLRNERPAKKAHPRALRRHGSALSLKAGARRDNN